MRRPPDQSAGSRAVPRTLVLAANRTRLAAAVRRPVAVVHIPVVVVRMPVAVERTRAARTAVVHTSAAVGIAALAAVVVPAAEAAAVASVG